MNGFERAVTFQRTMDEGLVERIVPSRQGRALLTPSLPRVFYLNHFSVDLGVDCSAEELIEEAEPILSSAKLTHRKVSVDDGLGERVEPGFRAAGWRVEKLLVMPYRGDATTVDTSGIEEVEPEEMEPIWERGIRSDPEITDDEEVRQLVAAHNRRRQGVSVRYFAARVDGEIASYCELFSDGQTGQIESVMTLERFRRRGLSKAVVSRALAESLEAHDFTFLVADAEDWPKEMYRKLGFEEAGNIWDFLLPPPRRLE